MREYRWPLGLLALAIVSPALAIVVMALIVLGCLMAASDLLNGGF